jgi:hypothetical protein
MLPIKIITSVLKVLTNIITRIAALPSKPYTQFLYFRFCFPSLFIYCLEEDFSTSFKEYQLVLLTFLVKKSSPLKLLGQMNQNLVGSILGESSRKISK